MSKKFMAFCMLLPMTLLFSTVVMAASGSIEGMITSTEFQGTTDFYYSNEWLVKFVQFAISWLCIIATIVYYLGWLCSLLVLSNKELFYLIDTIKKDNQDSGSDGKGFGAISSVISTFKNGGKDGVNGGFDNVLLFFLSLSINFKAYSFYKSVEAGSDNSEGGSKFNYNDTVLNFLLKTMIPSIVVLFATSVAISGTLLGCWFRVSDIVVIRAERFAQTNLSAKLDTLIGDSAGYKFSLSSAGTAGGRIAQDISQKIYVQVASQFPNATADQLQSLGKVIEDKIAADYLGNAPGGNYYSSLETMVRASQASFNKDAVQIKNEQQAELVSVKTVLASTNTQTYGNQYKVYKVKDIVEKAKLTPDGTNIKYENGLNIRVLLGWDSGSAQTLVKNTN